MRLTENLDSRPGDNKSGDGANGTSASEYQFRAGGQILSLFSTALHGLVLRALADGPMRLADLRKQVGGPPQTTLRGHLGNLIGMGALEKRSRDGQPNMVDNALTQIGLEMLFVADTLEAWLACCPEKTLDLESEGGKGAIKALIGGWNSTMLRALAARPFSLTELDNLITAFTYPALERRLSAMSLAGQAVAMQSTEKGTPYAVTEWLRQGMAPLIAAARCEQRHLAKETAPLTRIDIEAMLLLGGPLVEPPAGSEGSCQLLVTSDEDGRWRSAGISVAVEPGRLASFSSKLESDPATAARGSALGWFDAIVDGDLSGLTISGDRELAEALVRGLNLGLFSPSRHALA
jgi:DNA-binding HxlR family transcriptional regulator